MYRYKKIKNKGGTKIDEHRKIMSAGNLGPEWIIHHVDGNGRNNRKSNLALMSRLEHLKYHGFGTKIRPTSLFSPDENEMALCRKCWKRKSWEEFKRNRTKKSGREAICKKCYRNVCKKRYNKLKGLSG